MRFIVAIVLFVVAFASIGLGVAQRTIFAEPDRLTSSVEYESSAPVTVIDGSALNALDGRQTIAVLGGVTAEPGGDDALDPAATAPASSDAISAAYGASTDVIAWVGDAPYTLITWDETEQQLVAEPVRGTATEVPDLVGSDLWYQDYRGEGELGITLNVPEDVSLLVATDGVLPAPQAISVTWPLESDSPYSTPLLLGGFAALLLGLIALIWALLHLRKQRGPRRKNPSQPKMPRVPRPSRYRAVSSSSLVGRPKGRRAVRSIALLPVALAGTLVLGACTAPGAGPAPSPEPSASAAEAVEELPPVAVTASQGERIVSRVLTAVADADEARDGELAATRLAGPALLLRQTNYAAVAANAELPLIAAIPSGSVDVLLPQQTDTWPRRILAVVSNPEDTAVPPTALVLIQESPREDYKANYVLTLEPQAQVPEVAPASLGTPALQPDTPFLPVTPATVLQAYTDSLLTGEAAEGYDLFAIEGDSLRAQIGAAVKQERSDALPDTASIEFTNAVGDAEIVTLGTLDSGGIVVGYLTETETVRPTQDGASVNASGAVAALSGVESSEAGLVATYGTQVIFSVPSLADPDAPIVLLGYSQGLIAASEVS
ncbi:hypothetical protein OVN18_09075 [Microcella daejeonensis]|uniref:DUF8094 domain-containing protein n=1 Tax=Microcella daejeonensis TaxID=2994971 RepID=A0A9E8MJK1_9MICO|nr:hypothetical protein [Microcella daejeonensis]WAB80718.1 hypothetical protein OVN18_09075 [Microcella daejeonensis]